MLEFDQYFETKEYAGFVEKHIAKVSLGKGGFKDMPFSCHIKLGLKETACIKYNEIYGPIYKGKHRAQ